MNCQDVAAILDDRDIEALSTAERLALDSHLADCRQCREEWAVHQQLIASPVPPMPGRLGQRLHELARFEVAAKRPRRAGGRPMLLAGLMLVGAAAAALVGAGFFGSDRPEPDAGAIADSSVELPAETGDFTVPSSGASGDISGVETDVSASVQADAATTAAAADSGTVAPARITVAISPLIQATDDSNVVSITEAIYGAMLDELRAVPNLTLVVLAGPAASPVANSVSGARFIVKSGGQAADAVALEEIATDQGAAAGPISFELEPALAFQPAEGAAAVDSGVLSFDLTRSAAGAVAPIGDDSSLSTIDVVVRDGVTQSLGIDLPMSAAGNVTASGAGFDYVLNVTGSGRIDPATGTRRWFDFNVSGTAVAGPGGMVNFGISGDLYSSQDPAGYARQAVDQLRKLLFQPDESTIEALQSSVLDPTATIADRLGALSQIRMIALRSGIDGRIGELVPAVIDMEVSTTDPGQRAWIWELIRGSDDSRLVAPLVDSLLYDADAMVRLAAARTLVTFPNDPTAIAALEQAGRFDASEDVSQFAGWASMNEAEHRATVASALLDAGLTDGDRMAPLTFAVAYPYGVGGPQLVRGMDAEAKSALVGLLERTQEPALKAGLMQNLVGVDQADVIGFLIDSLGNDASDLVRISAIASLRDSTGRSDVRQALENASANDASPVVRNLAKQVLGADTD